MSTYIDSRNDNVELDYESLVIQCPVTFNGGTNFLASGIPLDNTITNKMLGLNGNIVSYKNNVVDKTTAQTLLAKSLTAGPLDCRFIDPVDGRKQLFIDLSACTTATSLTLAATQTANRIVTFPDRTSTIVTETGTPNITLLDTGNPYIRFGTQGGELAFANTPGTWFTDSIAGDVCLRTYSGGNSLRLGVTGSDSAAQVRTTGLNYLNFPVPVTVSLALNKSHAAGQININSAAAAVAITLPAVVNGLSYTFVVCSATLANAVTIGAGSAIIFGSLLSSDGTAVTGGAITTAKSNVIIGTTAAFGDMYYFTSDGVKWYVRGATAVHGSVTTS